MSDRSAPVIGIFVGGEARRMGGIPKGLLRAPGTAATLVRRTATIAAAAAPESPVVLVGMRPAYQTLGWLTLVDSPEQIGPLGGLAALFETTLSCNRDSAIALACDLPFLTPALLGRLVELSPQSATVAPKVDGRWQPFFARYAARAALPAARRAIAAGERRARSVLERIEDTRSLPLDEGDAAALRDWDTPADVERDGGIVSLAPGAGA